MSSKRKRHLHIAPLPDKPRVDHESLTMHIMAKRGLYDPLFPELFTDDRRPFGTETAEAKYRAKQERIRADRKRFVAQSIAAAQYLLPTFQDAIRSGEYEPLFFRDGKPYDQDWDMSTTLGDIMRTVSQRERDQGGAVDEYTIARVALNEGVVSKADVDKDLLTEVA